MCSQKYQHVDLESTCPEGTSALLASIGNVAKVRALELGAQAVNWLGLVGTLMTCLACSPVKLS